MADPYTGTSNLLSQDIPSSYFQNLLQNSSSGGPILGSKQSGSSAAGGLFFRQDCRVRNAVAIESSSGFNLSDPGCFYAKESIMNPVASVGVGNSDEITSAVKGKSVWVRNDGSEVGGNRKEEQAIEASVDPVQLRSSKRSRAPEVHNLSEKRRRSRINEKLKALQNLIPNSNKTDKASMLDEAIEYLKQLQLQVQMLTMRNGLSFPIYLPGSLQAMQPPQTGIPFDDSDVFPGINRDAEAYSRDHEMSVWTFFDSSSHATADPALVVPMIPDITNPETSFCLDSSIKASDCHQDDKSS